MPQGDKASIHSFPATDTDKTSNKSALLSCFKIVHSTKVYGLFKLKVRTKTAVHCRMRIPRRKQMELKRHCLTQGFQSLRYILKSFGGWDCGGGGGGG